MSNTTEVDTAPEAVGEEHAESSKTSAEISQNSLANRFRAVVEVEDVVEEVEDASESEVEKPASDPETDSQPEEEDSITEDKVEETESEEETDEEEGNKTPPSWWKERIDKLSVQRKEAEERLAIVEAKLSEKESKESPASTVDDVTDMNQLSELEQQAIEAQDTVDELLDTEPEYDDDGNAVWTIGDNKLTKKELINIRKNARESFRKIPARKQFLEQKANIEAKMEKVSFFSDKDDPYYKIAQETLNSKVYKDLERNNPDAKAAVYLMIKGRMQVDAEQQQKKKPAAVKKPTELKSTPTSKAATDTGTTAPVPSPGDLRRKRIEQLKRSGENVSSEQAAEFFR